MNREFTADAGKTQFDIYFAADLARALTEAQGQDDPLRWLAELWRLDVRKGKEVTAC